MQKEDIGLAFFEPLVRRWFLETVGAPTDIQGRSWPAIARGEHVLVTAPTGSGKTLTAFLWAINNFIRNRSTPEGCRVLYISPLKALNNDIRRNLQKPLEELKAYYKEAGEIFPEIRVAVRSGDTEQAERRKMLRNPPEILITTPESLNVLLSSRGGCKLLAGISTVILDEIHAVADGKRGTFLITAVERLVPMCGEFQRIALSATVKPLERVAEFIGGYRAIPKPGLKDCHFEKRSVSVFRSDIQKNYHIAVDFPETAEGKPSEDAWWPALTAAFGEMIARNRSTLFFANSRRMVEKVTRFINESAGEDRAYSHHGALSKEIRSVVEKRFKEGQLAAIVATSSLELGIDIGSVDEVVLIQAPYSIASGIQRIGRAGHGVGQVSRGTFCPVHTRDLLEAAVMADNIDAHSVESIQPPQAPLDVLAQVILSMCLLESKDIDDLYNQIRTASPYHRISRKEYDLVLEMLAGRYADSRIRELKPRLLVDRVKNSVKTRDKVAMLLYLSGGVIPDRGYFNLRVADTKAKIGELDEEFVWERSLGDAFPLGNQVWRILRVTHNDVEVAQVAKSNSLIPFWRAEDLNRSFFLSQKIANFLEEAEETLATPGFKETLVKRHYMSETAAEALIAYLKRQKEETNGAPLPHRRHILVEHFRDPVNTADAKQTVLHTLWGGRVNRPFAFALAAAWEEKYNYPLNVFVNNDCILLNLPHDVGAEDIFGLVKPSRLKQLLRTRLESTGYFGARFRENAQRSLLLPKQGFHNRMPLWLNRLRSKKLLEAVSRFEDFPILLETWRQCFNHEFEMEALTGLLEEIGTGEIEVTEVANRKPSPFADGVIWRQTNQYMYEGDSPESKLRTQLSDSLLKEVMVSSHLRPRFSAQLLERFRQKVQRVAPGYAPTTGEELLHWVKERLFIPHEEWEELLGAVERDGGVEVDPLVERIDDRLFWVKKDDSLTAVIALENLPRLSPALGIGGKEAENLAGQLSRQLKMEDAFKADPDEAFAGFLEEWLQFYGPIGRDYLVRVLGVGETRLSEALETLLESDRILIDQFRGGEETDETVEMGETGALPVDVEEEICLCDNLEILLRMRRSLARPTFEPLDIEKLPLFVAHYQGVTASGEGPEDLQDVLERLFGYPARAGLWESDILPARLNPYFSSWLDGALRDTELLWFGAGRERVSFCFEMDYELFYESHTEASGPPGQTAETADPGTLEKVAHWFSQGRGKFELSDIADALQMSTRELTPVLWELTWSGRIGNEDLKTLRKGILNRFRLEPEPQAPQRRGRYGFNRWKSARPFGGNWYALKGAGYLSENGEHGENGDDSGNGDADGAGKYGKNNDIPDALDRQELVKDRVRQLFMRYGILFRELLWNELPMLRWSKIFRVLRLMELSGEIVTGHFFKGIPGLQFCAPSALGVLTKGLPEEAVYWLNAADPASLCGIGLEELKPALPHRLVSNHVVYEGKDVVLVSRRKGKELTFNVEPGHPGIPRYLEFFKTLVGREFQPLKFVNVEKVNDELVSESPYYDDLKAFGFRKDYRSMVLEKVY